MIGLTTRYMAFCISSEAAVLAEAEANFKNLSTEITHVLEDLDAKARAMASIRQAALQDEAGKALDHVVVARSDDFPGGGGHDEQACRIVQ